MKKGDIVKGYKVLDVVEIKECNSVGYWLKHERTGLEVFHLLNDDDENLFAFAFRTPPVDSTGAAHVLEHSVLCGSKNYPLKDPFARLLNQSVNTYLNAWTAPDRTVFPASTQVKADYYNLMSVYGDAVFFPQLKPEIFLQEAHRLEVDAKGKPSIQGVVYNEMKGSYSSFEEVANDAVKNSILAGTCFVNDSGGDPLVIPSLTLSKLKAFHKKYYRPANCLLFLYGNIPTEEQLDFVNKRFLSEFKTSGKKASLPKPQKCKIKHFVHSYGPSEEIKSDGKSTVVLSFKTSKKDKTGAPCFERLMENAFISELLFGSDSAPISKALLKSALGEDIAPQTGINLEKNEFYISAGLRGVEEKNVQKVKNVIITTLADLVRTGVDKEDVERTCHSFEFDNREVVRVNGPFSLIYLRRCLRGWLYGGTPWSSLLVVSQFEKMKREISKNKNYITDLLNELFLDNEDYSLVEVTPSSSWSKKRAASEKKITETLFQKEGIKRVKSSVKKLYKFQQKEITEKEQKCVPHISINDLKIRPKKILTKVSKVNGIDYFENKENTNGIIYADVAFPADVLSPSDYPYIPIMTNVSTQMGWGSDSWEKTTQLIGSVTGGFAAYSKTAPLAPAYLRVKAVKNYQGREWIIFTFKMLEEQAEEAFALASNCISKVDFSNQQRLNDLVKCYANDGKASVVDLSHLYAYQRANRLSSRGKAIAEIWDGISSLFTEDQMCKMNMKDLGQKFNRMLSEVKNGGAVIHVTSDKKGLEIAEKILPSFIKNTNIKPLKSKRKSSDNEFFALTEIPNSLNIKKITSENANNGKVKLNEVFLIPGTVGFSCESCNSSPKNLKDVAADIVLTNALSKTIFWEKVRTAGGAYGVYLNMMNTKGLCDFFTYRDPKPYESLEIFADTMVKLNELNLSPSLIEKTIIGSYSDEIQPQSPSGRGSTGFFYELTGLLQTSNRKLIDSIISIQSKELNLTKNRFECSMNENSTNKVIICSKELLSEKITKNTGKIIKLPV